MQQLRGSMFSLTLMSKGEKRTGLPLLPSMPKGEIVGRFTVGSKLVIDGKNNDGQRSAMDKDQRWQRSTMTKDQRWQRSAMAKISDDKDQRWQDQSKR
jgi:hypothetical protein